MDTDHDVSVRDLDTAIGRLLLAATDDGLVHIAFGCEDEETVLAMLSDRLGPRIDRSPGRLDEAATQIEEYLAGRRRHFDLDLDTRLARGFRGDVQRRLADIDYGRTVTYSELAARLGHPAAVRAVGTACATNPLPLVWPCHRVLRSDGGLGGYRGGVEAKRVLLDLESSRAAG